MLRLFSKFIREVSINTSITIASMGLAHIFQSAATTLSKGLQNRYSFWTEVPKNEIKETEKPINRGDDSLGI